MKVGDARVVLRPRSLGEQMELGLRWQSALAGPLYLKLSALCLLPSFALCLWARYSEKADWADVWLLALTLNFVIQGVFTVANSLLFFREGVTVKQVFAQLRSRLGAYIGMLFFASLLFIGMAMTVFLIPIFCTRCLFAYETCLLEGQSALKSLNRSSTMVRGLSFQTLGACISLSLAMLAFITVSELLGLGATEILDLPPMLGGFFEEGGSIMAIAGLHLSTPFISGVRFLSYIDNRTRRDAWDVQVRLMAMAAQDKRLEVG